VNDESGLNEGPALEGNKFIGIQTQRGSYVDGGSSTKAVNQLPRGKQQSTRKLK
jgi:hypothetical protein